MNGVIHGKGVIKHPDGKIYDGEFRNFERQF